MLRNSKIMVMVIGFMYDIVFQETHKSKEKKTGNGKFLFGSLHSFMTNSHKYILNLMVSYEHTN